MKGYQAAAAEQSNGPVYAVACKISLTAADNTYFKAFKWQTFRTIN